MNSIWNKNIALFQNRFPQLAEMFSAEIERFSAANNAAADGSRADENSAAPAADGAGGAEGLPADSGGADGANGTEGLPADSGGANGSRADENPAAPADGANGAGKFSERLRALCPFWQISEAKNGSPVASENGLRLHSAYNPEAEARKAVESGEAADCAAAVFLGFGAGYTPQAFASRYPDRPAVLIEPDAAHFFAALSLTDWTAVFSCRDVAIALACPPEQAVTLVTRNRVQETAVFCVNAHTAHAQSYFETVRTLISRNRQKEAINGATYERFSGLWMRSSCRNLGAAAKCDGVRIYANRAAGRAIPFTLVAAGPSLEKILPLLPEIKKRSVIVCVDTALRACLRRGVEPDFIVLADPQYWAYRHIAGLSSPSSVLITELAVYPPVFRFPCRKTVCFSSFSPVGRYFERRCGEKGSLGAGGSVASAAWNFARLAGASEIFTAGLDLAFPGRKTHIPGSTFEQSAHTVSRRTAPAETANLPALFSGDIRTEKDYGGHDVLTDRRMKLFAWWFESRIAACPETATYTLSPDGLAVPGIRPAAPEALLSRPEITAQKQAFLDESEAAAHAETAGKTDGAAAAAKNAGGADSAVFCGAKNVRAAAESAAAEIPRPAAEPFETVRAEFVGELRRLYRAAQAANAELRTTPPETQRETERAVRNSCAEEIAELIFPPESRIEKLLAAETAARKSADGRAAGADSADSARTDGAAAAAKNAGGADSAVFCGAKNVRAAVESAAAEIPRPVSACHAQNPHSPRPPQDADSCRRAVLYAEACRNIAACLRALGEKPCG